MGDSDYEKTGEVLYDFFDKIRSARECEPKYRTSEQRDLINLVEYNPSHSEPQLER